LSELSELIGKQIRFLRNKKGLKQDQVAERTGREGYNKSRISKIESGKENVTLETLELIMHALDVTPQELFDFGKSQDPLVYQNKQEIVESYKYMLMERELEEIRYIVRTSQDLFGTIDSTRSQNTHPAK